MHRASPQHKSLLDTTIGFRVASEHLQPGAGTDDVMREGQDDPSGIRVVGRFIPSTVPKDPSNFGAIGCVGREPIGIGPMATIIVGGHRSVITSAHDPCNVSRLRGSAFWRPPIGNPGQHGYSAPGGTILLKTKPRRFDLAACLEAR